MSVCEVFVSKSIDISFGFNRHMQMWAPLPKPMPTPIPSFEMVAFNGWPPGRLLNTVKLTTNVEHQDFTICLGGHDCGPLIIDISLPPPNQWYPIMWLFSSRQIVFQASSVTFEGDPAACAQTLPMPLWMMTCGDPAGLPTAMFMTSFTSTLKVGMSWTDLLMGLLKIALSIAIDLIFDKLGGGSKAGKEVAEKASKEAGEAAAKKVTREAAEKAAKEAATKEAAEKAQKEAMEKAIKEGGDEAGQKLLAKQLGKEAMEKQAAKEVGSEFGQKAAKEGLEKGAREAVEKEAAERLAKEASEKATKEAAEKAAKEASAEAMEKASKEALRDGFKGKLVPDGNEMGKIAVTSLTGYGVSHLEGNPTFEVKVNPYVSGQVKHDGAGPTDGGANIFGLQPTTEKDASGQSKSRMWGGEPL